jgi:hypothetical protein
MTRFRTTIASGATALVAAALVAPAAFGGGDHGTGDGAGGAKSKITIEKIKPTGMSGEVTSKERKCEKNRRVQIFRLDDFISVKLDIVFADNKGNWRSKKDLDPGTYFAKVDSINGCRYDVSDNKKLR